MTRPLPSLSRRQCLKVLAVSGAAAGLALRFDAGWLDALTPDLPEAIHETHYLMGCVLNLTLISAEPTRAKTAAAAALAEMQRLAAIFTRHDPASQLSQLNAQGVLRAPAPALVDLLEQAEAFSRASQGAFDVTIKPLLDLYRAAQGSPQPSAEEIRACLKKVDHSKLVVETDQIGFLQPGMSLTLDGIAKGAVIDGGVSVLRACGFGDVIVEAGGDLLASGAHALGVPWKIGLRSPRLGEAAAFPVLKVQNRAVATSGDYLQPFIADYSAHHILDPRKGVSSAELASATVIAPSAVVADALATGIMVAGSQEGLEMLRYFPGCEAHLITKDLQPVSSSGMANYLD